MAKVAIAHAGGLHTRVAATAADLLFRCVSRAGCNSVYLKARGHRVLFTDLLAVVSLNLKMGDEIEVIAEDGLDEARLEPVIRYLGQPEESEAGKVRVDERIQEMVLTSYTIFEQMAHGLIVVNLHGDISYMNRTARDYLDIADEFEAIGKSVEDVVPNTRLAWVLRTGRPEIAQKQRLGERTVLTNRTPIIVDGEIAGAMAVFQNISEVERLAEELSLVKELKTRLDLVLQAVHDAICVADETGNVRYVNEAYEELYGIRAEDVVGRPIRDCPLGELCDHAMTTGQAVLGKIVRRGTKREVVADALPIHVGEEMRGMVSVSRSLSEVEKLLAEIHTLQMEKQYLQDELSRHRGLGLAFLRIVGQSGVLLDCLDLAEKAARTSSTVLITGESGTGKELVAQAIHGASPRRDGPFVRVNCAGIPPTLIESELFGHERGAFTGATAMRKGKFELADGGTIFLDEIGELPLEVQSKLLRVLQEREVERIGSTRTIRLDVRVIAATNRELEREVERKSFRQDLYYRIHVVHVQLPPLRERTGDVPLLAEHFASELGDAMGKTVRGFTHDAMKALTAYHWPGNNRELKNVVERAMNVAEGKWIELRDLPAFMRSPTGERIAQAASVDADGLEEAVRTMDEYEREIIAKALRMHGSFNRAAKALGLSHKTVASKARKYGLVE